MLLRRANRLSKPKEGDCGRQVESIDPHGPEPGRSSCRAVHLHCNKTIAGLFSTNAAGKQAAQRCQEDGYLCLVDAEKVSANGDTGGTITQVKKKTASASALHLTEKGLTYLLSQVSPRQVLEDFVRTLEARRNQTDDLLNVARQMQQGIEALKTNVEKVLQHTYQIEGGTEAAAARQPEIALRRFPQGQRISRGTPAASTAESVLHEALLAELSALAAGRRFGGLSAAASVSPGVAAKHRPISRCSPPTPRSRQDLSAPLDRPALRHSRTALRAADRPRNRILRQYSQMKANGRRQPAGAG